MGSRVSSVGSASRLGASRLGASRLGASRLGASRLGTSRLGASSGSRWSGSSMSSGLSSSLGSGSFAAAHTSVGIRTLSVFSALYIGPRLASLGGLGWGNPQPSTPERRLTENMATYRSYWSWLEAVERPEEHQEETDPLHVWRAQDWTCHGGCASSSNCTSGMCLCPSGKASSPHPGAPDTRPKLGQCQMEEMSSSKGTDVMSFEEKADAEDPRKRPGDPCDRWNSGLWSFIFCCRHPACWKGDLNLVCIEGLCQCRGRMAWEAR